MTQKIDGLHKSYLTYTESPETEETGDCQKVDGRGWGDTKQESSASAELFVKNAEGISATKYQQCD